MKYKHLPFTPKYIKSKPLVPKVLASLCLFLGILRQGLRPLLSVLVPCKTSSLTCQRGSSDPRHQNLLSWNPVELFHNRKLLVTKMLSLFGLMVLSASLFAVEPYEGRWYGTGSAPNGIYSAKVYAKKGSSTETQLEYSYWDIYTSGTQIIIGSSGRQVISGVAAKFDDANDDNPDNDRWKGQYSSDDPVALITWEASRVVDISTTPKAFEAMEEVSSFKSPVSSSEDTLYANGYFWILSSDKIHQVAGNGTVVNSFSPSTTASSLSAFAFDGAYLWVVGQEGGDKKIYQLTLAGQLVSIYNFPGDYFPTYMTFGNGYLWCIDGSGEMYQFDLAGNQVAFFDLDKYNIGGLVHDGSHLWTAYSTDNKLLKLSTSGTVEAAYDLSGSPDNLAYDGTYLWAIISGIPGVISKFDLSGNLISSYNNGRSGKLVFDGTSLWITGNSNLYKLHESSAAIEPCTSTTRTFTVTNDGSAVASISNFAITGTDAANFELQNNTCTNPLNTFNSCTLDVKFQTTTIGLKKAMLELASNESATPLNIPLSGGKVVPTPPVVHTVPIDQAGFYIASVKLAQGSQEGSWGLSVNTSSGLNTGGFNAGTVLRENGLEPGFVAFYLAKPEAIKMTVYEYSGKVPELTILLEKQDSETGVRTPVLGPQLMTSGQSLQTPELEAGFYIASASSQTGDPRGHFGISLNGENFTGGVNLGGAIDTSTGGNGEGFGAFYVNSPQEVKFSLLSGDNYPCKGAGALTLDIYSQDATGQRVLYWTSHP